MNMIIQQQSYPCDPSKNILQNLQSTDLYIDAPCSGNGKCGKCKVSITGTLTPLTDYEKKTLTPTEIAQNIRLACQVYALGDCVVEICNGQSFGVQSEGTSNGAVALDPAVALREDQAAIGLAIDIGTTTVACYFCDLKTGARIATLSGLNEQRRFGADVISLIQVCMQEPDGLSLLQKTIVDEINDFIDDFCKNGYRPDQIVDVSIAANTVMLHLFTASNPNGIAVAPFTPTSLFGTAIPNCGLHIRQDAKIYLSDCISGYVGGDITAGMLSSGLDKAQKPCLFLDIGTNGEMAIGDQNGFVCCATAAGPAFEGAHIKHGVGGINGAISKVEIIDGDLRCSTIGGGTPIGICGSGLIDAIACLLQLGVIDETGRMDEDEIPQDLLHRFRDEDDGSFFIDLENGIAITQKDVREIQLAKAAIAAGIQTLIHVQKLDYDNIDRLVLAGGFGSYIDKHSACVIGLLPSELEDKIDTVGNAAGMGAMRLLLSKQQRTFNHDLAQNMAYYELSGDAYFQDAYIDQMMFE